MNKTRNFFFSLNQQFLFKKMKIGSEIETHGGTAAIGRL
jgi:hypothetical protein